MQPGAGDAGRVEPIGASPAAHLETAFREQPTSPRVPKRGTSEQGYRMSATSTDSVIVQSPTPSVRLASNPARMLGQTKIDMSGNALPRRLCWVTPA